LIGGAAASVAVAALAAPHVRAQTPPRVVVIGGGFAGASCARALKRLGLAVTLIEPEAAYVACPLSNAVLAGLRNIEAQTFGYDRFDGIEVVRKRAEAVDAERRRVRLDDGSDLDYARLVLAPGVDLHFDMLPRCLRAAG
jgi:NADPH-dependent 2,4-dienoyl-CoA reductase/sulfur reductase-like enzyme